MSAPDAGNGLSRASRSPLRRLRESFPGWAAAQYRRFAAVVRAHKPVVAVLVLAAVVRIAFAIWASRGAPAPILGDQLQYWTIGNSIADGDGYVWPSTGERSAYYPVGWPALIAFAITCARVVGLGHHDVAAVVLMQIAFGVAGVWFLYLLAESIFGRRVALASATIMAVLPSLVFGVATFTLESAFIAGTLGCAALIVRRPWTSGPLGRRELILVGLAVGATAQVRPFVMPILIAMLLVPLAVGNGWRSASRSFAIAAVAAAVVFVPWTVRNSIALDAFVPTSTNVGDSMCMSRFPGSNGGFSWATHAYCADPDLPETERNTANFRAGVRFIIDHPGEELRQIGRRFDLMMSSDTSSLDDVTGAWGETVPGRERLPSWGRLANGAYWILVWTSVPGLVLMFWRRRSPQLIVYAVTLATLLGVPLSIWGAIRFHLPLLPLLSVASGVFVDEILSWARRAGVLHSADRDQPTSPSPID